MAVKKQKGDILLLVLTFMAVFLIMISGILGWVFYQYKLNQYKVAYEKAIQVAEAGVNYYAWHLSHDLDDYQDGTGAPGPYLHNYQDPNGGTIGQFSLEITPPTTSTTIVIIESTGWINEFPTVKRVIKARYGIPSLATYSFISNTNVWFGETEHVIGEMHSNGGIRMDGTNDSRVTSAKETYICGPEHGCNYEEKPGIWGTGGPQDLWDFPVPAIDFNLITTDLANLKTQAQTSGLYFNKTNKSGYHFVFLNDGTFNAYKVTDTWPTWGSNGSTWAWHYIDIKTETPLNPLNYSIPENGIIFAEDDVWVEGTINGRVTVAAARFPDISSTNKSIYLNNNINYLNQDGSFVLGLIAQKDILIPRYSPSVLNLDAVLLAQKGHVFRYYYSNNILSSITSYGSIITNGLWTWSWDCGGWICSGYENTYLKFDPYLTYSPPPYFPTTGEYGFISWEELPY